MNRVLKIGAGIAAIAIAFVVAVSITPASAETAIQVNQQGCSLTTSYVNCASVYCPDSTWTASGGGYYYDYNYPFADDIDIRASLPVSNAGVQGWQVDAKWHAAIAGETRNIVVQVVCIR